MLPLLHLIGVFTVVALLWKFWPQSSDTLPAPLPPGPPADPLIGHVRLIPASRPELTYMNWGREYKTDILFLNLIKFSAIILNSVTPAMALLDRKGALYSNRPVLHFFEEQGWKEDLALYNPGPQFKKHRRMFQNSFTLSNIVPYRVVQQREARKTILRLLQNPKDWQHILAHFTTSIILGITYGVSTQENEDPYVHLAKQVGLAVEDHSTGFTAVDIFPFIRNLPAWFKLIPSLTFAREGRRVIQAMRDIPLAKVKEDIANGIATPSFALKMLEEISQDPHEGKREENITEDDIKGAGVLMFSAGHETTLSTILVFILNMVLHPEVQQKAWAEIDSAIGRERLPTFEDRTRLPYVEHILQETFRWNPSVPLGVPHVTSESDIYNGMFIPKGSLVFANAHAMTHDEAIYQDPDSFDPDRYISKENGGRGEPFPIGQFGFGRRICPGRHLAEASVWILIATTLAALEFTKVVDEEGKEITPVSKMTTGITSHPEPFPCNITARVSNAVDLASRT